METPIVFPDEAAELDSGAADDDALLEEELVQPDSARPSTSSEAIQKRFKSYSLWLAIQARRLGRSRTRAFVVHSERLPLVQSVEKAPFIELFLVFRRLKRRF